MLTEKVATLSAAFFVLLTTAGAFLAAGDVSTGAIRPPPDREQLFLTAAATPTPAGKGTLYAYKGFSIGATADAVRTKLGEPKDKSDAQDLYIFSEEESAQFLYDATHTVTAIMVTYTGKLTGAPTAKDVFGEDVPAKPDGGISKMVRYQKAGFWISYNRIIGDDSMISIAMQKL